MCSCRPAVAATLLLLLLKLAPGWLQGAAGSMVRRAWRVSTDVAVAVAAATPTPTLAPWKVQEVLLQLLRSLLLTLVFCHVLTFLVQEIAAQLMWAQANTLQQKHLLLLLMCKYVSGIAVVSNKVAATLTTRQADGVTFWVVTCGMMRVVLTNVAAASSCDLLLLTNIAMVPFAYDIDFKVIQRYISRDLQQYSGTSK